MIEKSRDLLAMGLRTSEWALTSGGHSQFYFDLDPILSTAENIDRVADLYLNEINICKDKYGIDRLAFIEKDSGPIGALTLKDLLIYRSGIPGLVIRVQRRIISAAVKSNAMLGVDEKILLINDVATSGAGILKAARVVWNFKAKLLCAVVFFDREQGAVENLKHFDIDLRSIYRRSSDLSAVLEMRHEPIFISASSVSYTRE